MFILPTVEELKDFKPDWTILNACKTTCSDFAKYGLRSEVFVAFNITERMTVIGGTWYGGEMKKGGRVKKRADGGMLHNPIDDKDRGHKKERVTKKRGGRVHGEKPKERMDRRARGGGMNSDTSPFTAAAKMSEQDYEGDRVKGGTKAKGPDKGSAN